MDSGRLQRIMGVQTPSVQLKVPALSARWRNVRNWPFRFLEIVSTPKFTFSMYNACTNNTSFICSNRYIYILCMPILAIWYDITSKPSSVLARLSIGTQTPALQTRVCIAGYLASTYWSHKSSERFSAGRRRWDKRIFLSDPGIPGVRSMGRKCL